MKNVLFIGPYRQSDGWGNAAREYLRALKKTKFNIISRPIYLNSQNRFENITEFDDTENKSLNKCDVVIQNCLPHMFRKFGGVKNIGISFFESTVKFTPWEQCMHLMDEMWVSSQFEKEIVEFPRTKVVPIPTNVDKYRIPIQYNNLIGDYNYEYKFYFIGEIIERKNLFALIKAFHLEFSVNEPVRLILKLNKVGSPPAQVAHYAGIKINEIKESIGRYSDISKYKNEVVITEFIPDNDMAGLHKECDCFVMPSSGEGFCIPALDAMGFGSYILVNKNSSMNQFLTPSNGIPINSHKSPAISKEKPLRFLYNGLDTWYDIDVKSLMESMRSAYEQKPEKEKIKQENLDKVNNYSYDTIAKRIEEII